MKNIETGQRIRVYAADEYSEKLQAALKLAEINAQSLAKQGALTDEQLSGIEALFPKLSEAETAAAGSIVRTDEGLFMVDESGVGDMTRLEIGGKTDQEGTKA